MTSTIDTAQARTDRTLRTPALVAGIGLGVMAILAGSAVGAIDGLVTTGDATKTAHDIVASEGSFRLAIAAMVVVAVLDMIVAWALFAFFTPVNRSVSLLAAWMRVAYAVVFAVAISQLSGALALVGNDDYLKTFTADQLHTEALSRIGAYHDIWTVGLVLFGLNLLLLGYLAYTSRYVPRLLGALLGIAGLSYLTDSFVTLLAPAYSARVATFTIWGELFEVLLMLWLLIKGRNVTLHADGRQS